MKVRELYDYILTVDENLEISIDEVCVCNWITTGDRKIFLSTNFENAPENEDPEPYILKVDYLKTYLEEHKDTFDYDVYCSGYPMRDDETKVTVLALDLYTKDAVNLMDPKELDENGIPRSISEKKPGLFERLFRK
ncbi:hypothetical protein [Butyrivibrio fibrisolvens]|jgi:hypothetical protein|uniref:Uncharacterized protein n=1 Tax=Butyrivibrio fibrisolvens TaxID=831 RepID=A0A1H9UEE5_BUTFI|nr:hypothetical protein [Butyrivibrio fibrisolvens]SES07709.1 hypothetical protein SAMN04487884_11849 [Butyrivibrio fibrisolvens]